MKTPIKAFLIFNEKENERANKYTLIQLVTKLRRKEKHKNVKLPLN